MGYTLCLLKHFLNLEDTAYERAGDKPVCIGYFGRAVLHRCEEFKEYMMQTAEKNAEFRGNRKQLLLYPFCRDGSEDERLEEMERQFHAVAADGETAVPASAVPRCFGCITVLNLNGIVREQTGLHEIGAQTAIRRARQRIQDEAILRSPDVGAVVLGLLGAEDLCVLSWSDSYPAIEEFVQKITRMKCEDGGAFALDTYSILTVNNHPAAQPVWGDARAEICFTLRDGRGMAYVREIEERLREKAVGDAIERADGDVLLMNRIGKYDVALLCPACMLDLSWYTEKGGFLNHDNPALKNAAIQSCTLLYSKVPASGDTRAPEEGSAAGTRGTDIIDFVNAAYQTIKENIIPAGSDAEESDIVYIKQVLFRLLKDYQRISAPPYDGVTKDDLSEQFRAAVSAIITAAKRHGWALEHERDTTDTKANFDKVFREVINALHQSMHAASQIDKLYFEEQQTHLHNTGVYHKVLLAYYGLIKSLIKIVYSTKRDGKQTQKQLIPIIQLGLGPIVESISYPTELHGDRALLIVLTLPYQAFSNIPKYTGMLVHEVFHYSAPRSRAVRNDTVGRILCFFALKGVFEAVVSCAGEVDKAAAAGLSQAFAHELSQVAGQMTDTIRTAIESRGEDYGGLQTYAYFRYLLNALSLEPDALADDTNPYLLYDSALRELVKLMTKRDGGALPTWFEVFCQSFLGDAGAFRTLLRKSLTGLEYKKIPELNMALEEYIGALSEVAPDLFDISLVMQGKPPDEQLLQYLWQLHSINCDKLLYQQGPHNKLTQNPFRIGLMIDCLMSQVDSTWLEAPASRRRDRLAEQFCRWFGHGEDAFTREENRLCQQTLQNYTNYLSEIFPYHGYMLTFTKLILEQVEHIRALDLPEVRTLSHFYGEYYNLFAPDVSEPGRRRFQLNIDMMEHYQYQPALAELLKDWGRHSAAACTYGTAALFADKAFAAYPNAAFSAWANSSVDLSAKVAEAYGALHFRDLQEPMLWFRGQGSKNYKLLPNIVRLVPQEEAPPEDAGDDRQTNLQVEYLAAFLKKQLHLAKARASNIMDTGDFGIVEWLTLMQHYDFKTPLLDWSEDIHSALYFAIKNWIEHHEEPLVPGKKKKTKPPTKDATITIFNPTLYNLARAWLIHGDRQEAKGNLQSYLLSGNTLGLEDYPVPLFAAGEELEDYSQFLSFTLKWRRKKELDYPVAAMAHPRHSRMLAQSGMFTFYPLCMQRRGEKPGFSHMDILDIQDEYLKRGRRGLSVPPDKLTPFAFTICLDHRNWEDFVRYAYAVGIRKYKLYPEIDKIAGAANYELMRLP